MLFATSLNMWWNCSHSDLFNTHTYNIKHRKCKQKGQCCASRKHLWQEIVQCLKLTSFKWPIVESRLSPIKPYTILFQYRLNNSLNVPVMIAKFKDSNAPVDQSLSENTRQSMVKRYDYEPYGMSMILYHRFFLGKCELSEPKLLHK